MENFIAATLLAAWSIYFTNHPFARALDEHVASFGGQVTFGMVASFFATHACGISGLLGCILARNSVFIPLVH